MPFIISPFALMPVALFTRAWIEIEEFPIFEEAHRESPSLRGRGLKFGSDPTSTLRASRPLYEGVD